MLKHLPKVETCFYCPQALLSLDLQCRDDVSELKYMVWDCQQHISLHIEVATVKMLQKCANIDTPQDPTAHQQNMPNRMPLLSAKIDAGSSRKAYKEVHSCLTLAGP